MGKILLRLSFCIQERMNPNVLPKTPPTVRIQFTPTKSIYQMTRKRMPETSRGGTQTEKLKGKQVPGAIGRPTQNTEKNRKSVQYVT